MLHQLGCAFTEDVPQRMDRDLIPCWLHNRGAFHGAIICCSVRQAVVAVAQQLQSLMEDESSTSRQSAEKCDKTSASRDSSTEVVVVLRGWLGGWGFTLWLRRILTCNGCQGLGSATLKVWQLVDAKYWIIYGGTNKFQATVDSGAEWFLMGSWSGNLGW